MMHADQRPAGKGEDGEGQCAGEGSADRQQRGQPRVSAFLAEPLKRSNEYMPRAATTVP